MSTYCGDGEPIDRFDEAVHRAKNDRKCDACHQVIERGRLYHRTAYLYAGEWETIDRCARCEAMYRILQPKVRAWSDGDEVCDDRLNCGHTWQDNFTDDPPLEIQALAFLTPSEAQVLLEKSMGFGWSRRMANVQGPPEREDALMQRLLARMIAHRGTQPEAAE